MLAATPLRMVYGHEVSELAYQAVFHVDKLDFLRIHQRAWLTALSEGNVRAGFQATRLISYCREQVLSSLTVARTSSPPGTIAAPGEPWTTETPRTTDQLQLQG
jgi:hypothetical protein